MNAGSLFPLIFIALALAATADPPAARTGEAEVELAPVEDLDAFAAEIEKSLRGTKSVWSEFVQERELSLFDDPLITRGVMIFQDPDRVRWETTEPYHSVLLADGRAVAQYEWIEGKRRKINIGYPRGIRRMMSEISSMNRGRLTDKRREYDLSAWRGDRVRIRMVPRDAGLREIISSIEFEMTSDFGRILTIVMNEPNGDLTRIRVTSETRNVDLPGATFSTADPIALDEIRKAVETEAR